MAGVPHSVIFVSISLYNEREDPGQARGVRNVNCNNSCDETYCAPKHMKLDLVAVYDLGIVAYILSRGLSSWSNLRYMESPTSQADAMWHPDRRGLALVQRRILALLDEARKCSGSASEHLQRLGVLLYDSYSIIIS